MTREERRKKKLRVVDGQTIKRPNRVVFGIMSLFIVLLLALNVFVGAVAMPYAGFLNNMLNASNVKETEAAVTAAKNSADMTRRVEEEGIILLKNSKDVLPLSDKKVNVFGAGSVNFTYGGSGSGAGDESNNTTFYQGLKNAGFETNDKLEKFYSENVVTVGGAKMVGYIGSDFNVYEPSADAFTDELISDAKAFSDTAVIVISRVGGEGMDLPYDMADSLGGNAGKHYLELQDDELAMAEMVEDNFDHVIFVINSPNTMELGFLEDKRADAALWVGCVGSSGCDAIGEVLAGDVNPSGRTVDTFPYEVESIPSYYNFGDYDYTNTSYTNTAFFGDGSEDTYHYVEYQEGIYVGYRYFETAAADGFIDYDKTVQYPFGYGLSYTTFKERIKDFNDNGNVISMTVEVKNTGKMAGKDVVELYYTSPYTKNGIEKAEVVLGAFDKTELIAPGKSATVELTLSHEDMASYDYRGIKAVGGAYVLEGGEYVLSLRKNSHDVIDERSITVDRDYIFNDTHDGTRSTDRTTAVNLFDDVSDGAGIEYLSRSDWAGTMPKERAAGSKEATDAQIAAITGTHYEDTEEPEDIITKRNGLTLSDMKGLDYDDEKWELLLEQLSVKDMELLIGNGGWCTVRLPSIKKPHLVDCDGPNGVNNLLAGTQGNQFCSEIVLGYTWNKALAKEFGQALGAETKALGISGIYAPAVNTHRNPFAGRNYEYVSEDGFLTGALIASELQGIYENGVYAYTKHFAVNDQESNRDQGGLVTWLNEQALREIYLKPFEMCVKIGGTTGIMSSFNRIGAVPAAESYPLLTGVLRNEWGFQGMVITDCVMSVTTQDINASVRAGNDLVLTLLSNTFFTSDTTDTAAGHQALRKASHNILYTIANSDALEGADYAQYGWVKALIAVDMLLWILLALYFVRWIMKYRKWRRGEPVK